MKPAVAPREVVPPLESGDRLCRAEFERRYEAMPDTKAELIGGVVYVTSPVKRAHGGHHKWILTWLGTYEIATPGTEALDNVTFRLDEDDEPQPDACLRIEQGGRTREDEDGYLVGGVELAVEVAASSESYDLHQKKDAYRRHAVQEYLVVVLRSREVAWLAHRDGGYARLEPDARGVIRSTVFPGLWLDTRALLAGDGKKLLATLRSGLASKPHAAFVRALASRKRRRSRFRGAGLPPPVRGEGTSSGTVPRRRS